MIFFLVLSILFLDQFSKFLISKIIQLHQSVPVIPGIFHLTLIHNRGAAFGILNGQVPLFILISLIAVALVYFHLKSSGKENLLYTFSLSLILAGGIGNLVDRLLFGYVIDFLDFRIWPVFNIADSAITIGAILLGWSICIQKSVK